MCGYEKDRGKCTVIRLTTAEKKQLKLQGETPADELFYCPPCLRILQDPEAGPKFMRGVFEQQLRASGVPGSKATKLADEYYAELKAMQVKYAVKS
jgi:hypothetical protein